MSIMSGQLDQLPAFDGEGSLANVVVDSPKGSRNKYKYDPKGHIWRLSKQFPAGASFPFDFGFIPSTQGEDGDPLDVMVLSSEPAFAGCVLPCVLIGVLQAEQTEDGETVRNDRLIGVIKTKYNPPAFETLDAVPEWQLLEIEHFFKSYNEAEGRQFKVLKRRGPSEALKLVKAASTD
jgi:inorganic pyrophosphatase